jgi:hypothetical protein
LFVLLSFACSVSLTRVFLSLTGYPQIAGGELHIAHALWGGLLLFISALLPLLISNRTIFSASALIAGVGVGLFIDEVGKFITKTNNYFFPAAAPIFYTFFLLIVLLFLRYKRPPHVEDHAELNRAMDDVQEFIHHPVGGKSRAHLKRKLEVIAEKLETGAYARLAQQLLEFVESDDRPLPTVKPTWFRRLGFVISKWLTAARMRLGLILGLLGLGFISIKNPASILLSQYLNPSIENILRITAGRHVEASVSPELSNVRMVLELMVGTILILSAVIMLARQNRYGVYLAFVGLAISFTAANLLVFYFEQFSTLIMVAFQFVILFGLIEYYRRFLTNRFQ